MTENERVDKLLVWRAATGHVLAMILTLGFFSIVFLALTGWVEIKDPTTAQFVGTVTGYAISKLERPLAFYFGVAREEPTTTLKGKSNGHSNGSDSGSPSPPTSIP